MKCAAVVSFGVLIANAIAFSAQSIPAFAANFDQTEVEQDRFIAVAVPRNSNFYTLTILEQISNQKPCWRETGTNPVVVEPLLLQFDFTGVCGRSTDSNGYSIRHEGKDLGLQYRLTLQPQGNEVVLLGTPASGQTGPAIVLGRTRGLSSSLMKIDLDSGWKFTKRNYQGKTLGHIYLTREGILPMGGTTKRPLPTASRNPSSMPSSRRSSPSVAQALTLPPSLRGSSKVSARSSSQGDRYYRLYVKTATSAQQQLVRTIVPDSFRSSYQGQSVMQAGLFSDRDKARDIEQKFNRKGLRTILVDERGPMPVAAASSPSSSYVAAAPGSVLRVPSSSIPLGNARGEGDVYGRGNTNTPPPPPNPDLALAKRYKVMVLASSSQQQSKVRALVQDSFRSSYRGQSVMQVGSYTNLSEAQPVIQLMQRNGFKTVID